MAHQRRQRKSVYSTESSHTELGRILTTLSEAIDLGICLAI